MESILNIRTRKQVTPDLKKNPYDSRCPMSDPALETRASACILVPQHVVDSDIRGSEF